MPERVTIPLVVRYEKTKQAIRELESQKTLLVAALQRIQGGSDPASSKIADEALRKLESA
jgi:hypothetical protein